MLSLDSLGPSLPTAPSIPFLAIALLALLIATLTDLKRREVPDFLNYGLILLAASLAILQSVVFSDWCLLLYSAIGFALCFSLSWLMFSMGQWGGGDAKMLIGLGGLFGLSLSFADSFLLAFIFNIMIAGAFYGLLWSVGLAIWNRKKFLASFRTHFRNSSLFFRITLIGSFGLVALASLTSSFIDGGFAFSIAIALTAFFGFFLSLFAKAVESSCMLQSLPPKKITEGDWIAKDVIVGGKYLCGPKDLGISKSQISALKKLEYQGKVKTVLVKNGIPFIPSFLLAFLLTMWIGNPITAILLLLA